MLKQPRQKGIQKTKIRFPLTYRIWDMIQRTLEFPQTLKRYLKGMRLIYRRSSIRRRIKRNWIIEERATDRKRAIAIANNLRQDL